MGASGGLEAPKAQKSVDFLALLKSASSPETEPFLGQNWPSRPRGVAIVFFVHHLPSENASLYENVLWLGRGCKFWCCQGGEHLTPKVPASKFLKVPKWDKRGLGCASSGFTAIL